MSGRTDLDNLVLICSFHHRLVHEHGWSVKRQRDGTKRWFSRDGVRYRAGPSTASRPTSGLSSLRSEWLAGATGMAGETAQIISK